MNLEHITIEDVEYGESRERLVPTEAYEPPTITADSFWTFMDAIVAERGDYVYEPPEGGACVYADAAGAPSCIIGHYLAAEHPETFELVKVWEQDENTDDGSVDCLDDGPRPLVHFETSALKYQAKSVQVMQDMKSPWRAAVEEARARA